MKKVYLSLLILTALIVALTAMKCATSGNWQGKLDIEKNNGPVSGGIIKSRDNYAGFEGNPQSAWRGNFEGV